MTEKMRLEFDATVYRTLAENGFSVGDIQTHISAIQKRLDKCYPTQAHFRIDTLLGCSAVKFDLNTEDGRKAATQYRKKKRMERQEIISDERPLPERQRYEL